MLEQIRKSAWLRATNLALLVSVAGFFTSCATKREEPLISDRTSERESQLPWNQQEKWERQGQLGPMGDRLQSR